MRGFVGAAPRRTRADTDARLTIRAALFAAIAAAIVMAAPDTAGAQDAQAATITAAPSPDIGSAQPLPPMTIYSRQRKHARAIKRKPVPIAQAPRATPAPAATRPLPDGIVLHGGPAVTQTTAGPVSGYRALTSTSATKTDTPIERIPQAIALIPRAVIDDQQPLTQSEAFRNISGVSGMPANTYLGFAYKVRGFPADRYVDGLPNYYDGGDNASLVNTERIEVLKGPAGILYQAGQGPVGGLINSVSKLPTAS